MPDHRAERRWPLLDCRISRSWTERGFAHVLIARRGSSGITAGLFRVDLGCLEVKDWVTTVDSEEAEYRAFVEQVTAHDILERCDPALAVKVIEAGVARAPSGSAELRGIFGGGDAGEGEE